MGKPSCEVCETTDNVKEVRCDCGHKAYLCQSCIDDCPTALEQCCGCENNDPDAVYADDEEWRNEIATQAGMEFGVQGYNDAMGYDAEDIDSVYDPDDYLPAEDDEPLTEEEATVWGDSQVRGGN